MAGKTGQNKAKPVAQSHPVSASEPIPATHSPSRVIIDAMSPLINGGRFAAKAVIGKDFAVEAVILCDGHEVLKADLLYRHETETEWTRQPMTLRFNDTYDGAFTAYKYGSYFYTVEASIDRFAGWADAFAKKLKAGEAADVDAQTGFVIMDGHAPKGFEDQWRDADFTRQILNQAELTEAMRGDWSDPSTVRFPVEAPCAVEPAYAEFSSWYEFFPRSRWQGIAEKGTLKDAADRLPYIADLGFNVVYFPPIHPIGLAFRKGKNNTLNPTPDDTGSPWAIGGALNAKENGGHKAIHPALGTFADFATLVERARELGLEIALDIAFQCSPDHPYVKEHPEWFKKRPDGTIQYAENPPKKYQDIYPFDFETPAWQALWMELLSVIQFWVNKGVRIFRVDNPHTKAFPFWEWAIAAIRKNHPEVIFLAEAFAKPHVMAYLGKIGFNQSYTYFTWRTGKRELTEYMEQLTATEWKDYFRPNFWPNTPDILTEELQTGGRPSYVQRLILAATLSSNYGIYGPAFELMESTPVAVGKEEYLNSEKYELRTWDVEKPGSLAPLIDRVNRIRNENPALHSNRNLMFHPVDNDNIIAYTKESDDGTNLILTVVNLDRRNRQSGMVDLTIDKLGIAPGESYECHDLLSDARYMWHDWKNYIDLDPYGVPAHIFRISRPPAKVSQE